MNATAATGKKQREHDRERAGKTVGGKLQHRAVLFTERMLNSQACGAKVLLRPGKSGSGILASREVRAVLQCAGVKDAVGKSLGAQNPANVVKATLQALMNLRSPSRIYQDRGGKTPEAIKLPRFFKGPQGRELN